MSSVSVWRLQDGVRTDLRTQPSAGFDTRTVYDYECPYGVDVSYGWTADYTDPSAYTTLFNETWASVAAWTGSGFGVSAGQATNTSMVGDITRTFVAAKYRVTIASITSPAGEGSIFFGNTALSTSFSLGMESGVLTYSGAPTGIDPLFPITVDFLSTSILIAGTGGSFSIPFDHTLSYIRLLGVAAVNGFKVGAVRVYGYGSELSTSETSSTVELDPEDAWLIHPATPGLSFPLAGSGAAGIRSIGPINNESNATVHYILGSRTPVTTTNGDRSSDETVMTLAISTRAEEVALTALLRDETPILINIPPAFDIDFDYAFYQVGRTSRSRLEQMPGMQLRDYVLPLIEVQSPIVTQENTGWSYATVAATYSTYAVLLLAYDTYADLAADNRNPGY